MCFISSIDTLIAKYWENILQLVEVRLLVVGIKKMRYYLDIN